MKNEKLLWLALRILCERSQFWGIQGNQDRASAYQSAHDILLYALEGNEECLKEFDYYEKEETR